jgi:hypothetical protein
LVEDNGDVIDFIVLTVYISGMATSVELLGREVRITNGLVGIDIPGGKTITVFDVRVPAGQVVLAIDVGNTETVHRDGLDVLANILLDHFARIPQEDPPPGDLTKTGDQLTPYNELFNGSGILIDTLTFNGDPNNIQYDLSFITHFVTLP